MGSDRLSSVAIRSLLRAIKKGRLELIDGSRSHGFGTGQGTTASIEVIDSRFYGALLHGSRGLAESYANGYWRTPDLVAVIRLAARNAAAVDAVRRMLWPLREPYQLALGLSQRATRRRSRRSISAHYDLGNELFASMLDPTMSYSCALFERPGQSLRSASEAKLDYAARKLQLCERDHVLEIGCGWGGFALHAAERYGCRVTGLTLSREQRDWAQRAAAERGLSDRVQFLLTDYRDLRGRFDKICSIEMIEAVGHRDFSTYFARCSDLLRNGGLMFLQAITIDDRAYRVERASRSFMRTLIFPNGCLPSMAVIRRMVGRQGDLELLEVADRGQHYAETLKHWRHNLDRAQQRLERLGYDQRFHRLWHFYLSWCEAGFAEGRIGLKQCILQKTEHSHATLTRPISHSIAPVGCSAVQGPASIALSDAS